MTTVSQRAALRRGTAAQWALFNPVLAAGEEGYETDTGNRKVGDGATAWSSLRYNTMPWRRTAVKTAAYTAAAGELVPVDTATPNANITITLPTAPANGSVVCVKHVAVGAGKRVTVARGGADVFNVTGGSTSLTLTLLNQAVTLEYDGGIWTVVADDLPLAGLDNRYFPTVVVNVDNTGATDVSAAIQSIINTVYAAGGGTIYFPAGTYRCDAVLTMPSNGAGVEGSAGTPSQGHPLRLVGPGPAWDGGGTGLSTTGCAVLDLRGTGTAKLDTRYNGWLEITGLVFTNLGAADTTPFVFDTNTMVWIHDNTFLGHSSKSGQTCNQDAIVFGGQDSKLIGPNSGDIFQGYGTVVERNYFARVRRIVWARASTNGLVIRDNMIAATCGATSSEECIGIDGGSAVGVDYPLSGLRVEGNIIELSNYPIVVRVRNASQCVFTRNGYYDYTSTLVAVYRFEGDAALTNYATINDAHYDDAIVTNNLIYVSATTGGAVTPVVYWHGQVQNQIIAGLDTLWQPYAAQADSATIWEVRRATTEASNGNQQLLVLQNQGVLKLLGFGATLYVGANFNIGSDGSLVRLGSGQRLDLYAGTGANDTVRVVRGTLRVKEFTTAARPAASVTGVGTVYFDTTLNKPVWSDGANWRDSAGTIV